MNGRCQIIYCRYEPKKHTEFLLTHLRNVDLILLRTPQLFTPMTACLLSKLLVFTTGRWIWQIWLSIFLCEALRVAVLRNALCSSGFGQVVLIVLLLGHGSDCAHPLPTIRWIFVILLIVLSGFILSARGCRLSWLLGLICLRWWAGSSVCVTQLVQIVKIHQWVHIWIKCEYIL